MTPRTFTLLCFGISAFFLGTTQSQATPASCAAHTSVVDRLTSVYGERRQAMGVAQGNAVIEVYASDESGSWSITVTRPGGPTCLVAAGQGFLLAPPPLPAEDPDA